VSNVKKRIDFIKKEEERCIERQKELQAARVDSADARSLTTSTRSLATRFARSPGGI
jgi:hypothetical protein